jgi:hypothetical protein
MLGIRFEYRKQIFDYLKNNLTDVEILPEHPSGLSTDKPKVVVETISDSSAGLYFNPIIEQPKIKITLYANKDLILTKPQGLIRRVQELMLAFCPEPKTNFQLSSNMDCKYLQDTLQYFAFLCYTFY